MSRITSIALALALWGGAAGAQSVATILPGKVDLPVRAGTKEGACPFAGENYRNETRDCLALLGGEVDQAMNDYSRDLVKDGWVFAGGAAIQYWLEKPLGEGRCIGLDLTALTDFDAPEDEQRAGPGAILFEYTPERACRARNQKSDN